MPEDEKELENLDAEDFADMGSLADFVEIDDLESLEGMEEFADFAGDENDSDSNELSKESAADDTSVKEADTTEDEIPMPTLDALTDEMPMPEEDALTDETPMPEEDAADDEIPMPGLDVLEESPIPEADATEEAPMPDLDSLSDIGALEEEMLVPEEDDAQQEVPPSEINEMTEKMADADGDAPQLFAEDEEWDAAASVEALTEPVLEEDALAGADSVSEESEEEPIVLDALGDVDMALDETEEQQESDSVDDVLDVGLPDMDNLDSDATSEAGDDGLDMMLDGLLDNLDMTGSLEDEGQTETGEEEASSDMDTADLLGMLGDGDEENTEVSEDLFDVAIPDIEEEKEPEEKEPGLMKRLFGNVVTDEIAEAERKAMEEEEAKAAEKAELDEQKKEEKEQAKAEAAAEKEAKKAAKAEAKAAKKAEKEARKEEKRAQREEEEAAELEITGKLNKVGVAIIAVFTVVFLTVEIAGTNLYGYFSTKKKANDFFEMGKYEQAYQEVMGTKVKEKDPETYNKIRTVMQVQRAIDSYNNYNEMNFYPDALNALIRGLQRYDSNLEKARELEVVSQMDGCKEQILSLLQSEFGVSETEARSLLALEKEQYTQQVVDIAMKQNR